jgi:hypothetical protein
MKGIGWIALAILCSATGLVLAQGKLASDVYPGAVRVAVTGTEAVTLGRAGVSNGSQAFLSKDDPAKVEAFYKAKARSVAPGTVKWSKYFVTREWSAGELGTEQAGVTVYDRSGEPGRQCPVLRELQSLVQPKGHTKADYDALEAKYRHLNVSYFSFSEKKDRYGAAPDLEQVLLEEFRSQRRASGKQINDLNVEVGKKVQELLKQGKMEEAMAYANKARVEAESNAGAKQDQWPLLVGILEKLDKEAFRTLIVIQPAGGRY